MRNNERLIYPFSYLMAIFPVWGIIINVGLIYFYKKDSKVLFNSLQAIAVQIFFMCILLLGVISKAFCHLVQYALPSIGGMFMSFNNFILWIIGTLFCITCLLAAWLSYIHDGDFYIPFIGKKIKKLG